jgi:hypothetical protein
MNHDDQIERGSWSAGLVCGHIVTTLSGLQVCWSAYLLDCWLLVAGLLAHFKRGLTRIIN